MTIDNDNDKDYIKEEKKRRRIYSDRNFFVKFFLFWYWKIQDIKHNMKHGRKFEEFGVTMYTGRQGAGKTISMVEYLERMRIKYPNAIIVTNFGYANQDEAFEDWKDLVTIRNGEEGVIFAIDEIQNEFSSAKWKNFPDWILSEVTQQRKQRIKIVATSQVFTRVVKQLREQCFEVVECRTFAKRWTIARAFDAEDYNTILDNPDKKRRLVRIWRRNFVQDDYIRNIFNSYDKVEKIGETEFLDRDKVVR